MILLLQISLAMMHAIIIGCSHAIDMNWVACIKQVEKQWKQLVVITVHKFSYLKQPPFGAKIS